MSETTKFKVTLEFEVEIDPISVPKAEALQKLGAAKDEKKQQKPLSDKDMRAALKAKGMSDADIDKYLAGSKKGARQGAAAKGKPQDFQMLLYPEYEAWAAAQRSLQQEILSDDELSSTYVREMVRDLTDGKIETLLADRYGQPKLGGTLRTAMQKLSAAEQMTLKSEQASLLHDETELVDNSVDCRFKALTVTRT